MEQINRRILLASRPVGEPTGENFCFENAKIPELKAGEILLKTIYLSLDPYMRGMMDDKASYIEPIAIGKPMVGATVSQVVQSNHADYKNGDWVSSQSGWQDYEISNGEGLTKLSDNLANPSYALGVMGMPGFTAYVGLLDIGQPKAKDTLVVAAATGAVGANVGQIGKMMGCRVIGIAGGDEKCRYAKEVLGFDECINHRDENFAELLSKACDKGIDIYFENVGGKVFDAVLPLLNIGARIPVCGLISQYNATALPEGPDRLSLLMGTLLVKRIKMQGFIIVDYYADRYTQFHQDMSQWLQDGKIHYREDLINGLENAANAFIGLLQGKNFGKLVIKVNETL